MCSMNVLYGSSARMVESPALNMDNIKSIAVQKYNLERQNQLSKLSFKVIGLYSLSPRCKMIGCSEKYMDRALDRWLRVAPVNALGIGA